MAVVSGQRSASVLDALDRSFARGAGTFTRQGSQKQQRGDKQTAATDGRRTAFLKHCQARADRQNRARLGQKKNAGEHRWLNLLGEKGLALAGGALFAACLLMLAWTRLAWLAGGSCSFAGLGLYMLHSTLQTQATQMAPAARGAAATCGKLAIRQAADSKTQS